MQQQATVAGRRMAPVRALTQSGDRLLMRMLDAMEYGMVLVDDSATLCHANQLGLDELSGIGPLQLHEGQVFAPHPEHRVTLRAALADALRGQRRLMTFELGRASCAIAVIPMHADDDPFEAHLALLVFGKRSDATALAVDFYARAKGLTSAEAAVLSHLTRGVEPTEIARRQGVAISTIRSQIASVRLKTSAGSVRELLDRIAKLPPIRSAIQSPSLAMLDGMRPPARDERGAARVTADRHASC